MMTRRTVLHTATVAALAALTPAGAAAARTPGRRSGATDAAPVVTVTGGRLRGRRLAGGVLGFSSVPYVAAPVGALRFASPAPPTPWRGVRAADRTAPVFVQPGKGELAGTVIGQEDALLANVWTPSVDRSARLPVIVYIHGGGWTYGAGSLPVYDGRALAEQVGAVVVTFNYRLSGFGWAWHPALTDPRTGLAGNWGLQDQMALLHWVHDNAAAFGGDPQDITLIGTSAGGASTWQLGVHPTTRPLLRRIVPISAAHVWSPHTGLTREDAASVIEALARDLGVRVGQLREVPAERIQAWWTATFSRPIGQRIVGSGRAYRGPVHDPETFAVDDFAAPTPRLPTLAVHTRTEGTFFAGPGSPTPQAPPVTEAQLRDCVAGVLLQGLTQLPDGLVDQALRLYREQAQADGRSTDPVLLWSEIWGDSLVRYPVLRLADSASRQRRPIHVLEYAHPVRPPYLGVPHESTSPFLFGTYGNEINRAEYGDGPAEVEVSRAFISTIAAFVRTDRPAVDGRSWAPWNHLDPSVLVLGDPETGLAHVAAPDKTRQLDLFDHLDWARPTR